MAKKVIYNYPAILHPIKEGYKVTFPDFEGLSTTGKDTIGAIENGREVLAFCIDEMLNDKKEVPTPIEIKDIEKGIEDYIVLVDVNINVYRFQNKHKAVTKAVTLPRWLNERAIASGINVSALLQEALKEKLGIEED